MISSAKCASRVHVVFLTTSQPSHSRDSKENHTYEVQPGLHHYTILRSGFVLFSQMQIYVKAVNQLGEVMSPPIVLEPVSAGEKERKCVFIRCFISLLINDDDVFSLSKKAFQIYCFEGFSGILLITNQSIFASGRK